MSVQALEYKSANEVPSLDTLAYERFKRYATIWSRESHAPSRSAAFEHLADFGMPAVLYAHFLHEENPGLLRGVESYLCHRATNREFPLHVSSPRQAMADYVTEHWGHILGSLYRPVAASRVETGEAIAQPGCGGQQLVSYALLAPPPPSNPGVPLYR